MRDITRLAVRPFAFPPMLRQNDELPDNLRQFAISRRIERKCHIPFASFLGLRHVREIKRILRAVGLQRIKRENHILGRHRLAILPPRSFSEPIRDGRIIRRITHRFREQSVGGRNLVQCGGKQRLVYEPYARFQLPFHPRNNRVEIVKTTRRSKPHRPALRRVRVHIVEMLELFRIFGLPHQRNAVPPLRLFCRSSRHAADQGKNNTKNAERKSTHGTISRTIEQPQ